MTDKKDEEKDPSLKEDLKDEGSFFVKDVAVSVVNATKRAGHGFVNVLTSRKKVKDLKDEVAEHAKEIIDDIKE